MDDPVGERQCKLRPQRDDCHQDHGRHHGQDRRQDEQNLICLRRDEFLFEDQLDRVRNRLQKPLRSGPVRTDTRLDAGQCTAFIKSHIGKSGQQDQQNHQ